MIPKIDGIKLRVASTRRRKAEEALKERQSQLNSAQSEADLLRLVHELEVHQIELEMQNDELLHAKEQAELATAKYEELYEFAPSGYFILSREGKIIQLNIAGSQIFGKDRSQLIKSRFRFLISDDTRPIFDQFLNEVFSSNLKETCDLSLSTPNSLPLQVTITGFAEPDKDECFVTMVDITERKRNEKRSFLPTKNLPFKMRRKPNGLLNWISQIKELAIRIEENDRQHSEQISINRLITFQRDRLEEIASLVPGVVYQYRLHADGTSCFPYASEAINQIYRVTPDEVREDASKVFANLHPDDHAGVIASIQTSAKELTPWQHEYRVKFDDGTIRTLFGNALPRLEKDGSVLWHGFIIDITERKKADEKLLISEAKYHLLFENMEEGFSLQEIITDENNSPVDFRFLDANKAFERHAGLKPGDIIDKTIRSILPQSDPRQIEMYGKVALTGESTIFEYYSHTFQRHLRVKAFCPQPGQFATVFEDVTQLKLAEQDLFDSEARYRSMISNISDVIGIMGADGLMKYKSPNIEKFFGWLPEERVGASGFSTIHPDDIEHVQKVFYSLLEDNNSVKTMEFRYECKDGSYKPVELTAANLLNEPLVNGVLLNYRDISERKQMEEEKARQTSLINSLLDSIPDIIFFKDKKGVYLGCNPPFAAFVGKSRSEIIGKTDYDLFDRETADSFRFFDREMLKQKLPRRNEEWITYPHGRKILIDTLKTPYWADEGRLIGVLGVSRDITERKIAEEELKQLSARLSMATRSGGVGVWDYDIVSNILVWDDQMFALYGIKRADFSGAHQSWRAGLHPEDAEQSDAYIQMAIRGEKEFNTEFRVVWPDGSVHYIRAFAIVQRDNFGRPVNMIGTNWDITAQKQTEQEIKQKNEELQKVIAEKNKFFSIIAHDLRGPLGEMMGITEMMANDEVHITETEKKEITLLLNDSAHNTFNLLENLLEWSQMDRGLTDFKPQKLDLKNVVTDCLNIVAEPAVKKRIELIVDINEKQEVFVDKNMLQTVIRNLLSNAIKFTPPGGRVTISSKPAENNRMVISVSDTGIGMSDQMRDNLFSIGANTRRPGTEGEKSTGLGLLLCEEFVEKHGGKIRVESEQNHGTVFSFTISSVGEQQEKNIPDKVLKAGDALKSIDNLKILIAEDDKISAKLISVMVKGFSREVLLAKTGNDAVQISLANPDLNLILMDIAMPVMDGFEATRQIRQFNPEVVIIAQTTFALSADREKSLDVGCNDYITKPFSKDALIELLKKHF